MFGCYVMIFVYIGIKVIKFEDGVIRAHLKTDAFPMPLPYGLLAALLMEFPVEIGMFLLSALAQQRRDGRKSIGLQGLVIAGQFCKSREHVPKSHHMPVVYASLDVSRINHQHRHTNAALIEVPFNTTILAVTLEVIGIGSALMVWAVVGSKDKQCLPGYAQRIEQVHNVAHITIQACDHRCERCQRPFR